MSNVVYWPLDAPQYLFAISNFFWHSKFDEESYSFILNSNNPILKFLLNVTELNRYSDHDITFAEKILQGFQQFSADIFESNETESVDVAIKRLYTETNSYFKTKYEFKFDNNSIPEDVLIALKTFERNMGVDG